MKLDLLRVATGAVLACSLGTVANADEKPKRVLKNNMMVKTNTLPSSVDNIKDAFTKGMFYGRLRMNSFKWDWKNDDTATTGTKDNKAFGLGGSLIYKSAPFKGVSGMAGLYYGNL